jgi:hypothetical protein
MKRWNYLTVAGLHLAEGLDPNSWNYKKTPSNIGLNHIRKAIVEKVFKAK